MPLTITIDLTIAPRNPNARRAYDAGEPVMVRPEVVIAPSLKSVMAHVTVNNARFSSVARAQEVLLEELEPDDYKEIDPGTRVLRRGRKVWSIDTAALAVRFPNIGDDMVTRRLSSLDWDTFSSVLRNKRTGQTMTNVDV